MMGGMSDDRAPPPRARGHRRRRRPGARRLRRRRARPHRRRRAAGPRLDRGAPARGRGPRASRWSSSSAVDAGALRAPEIEDRPPYALDAGVRVRARTPLLPRSLEQLRRPERAAGVGSRDRGGAARREGGRHVRRPSSRRHARRGSTAGRASVRSPASRAPSCTESGSRTVTSRPTGDAPIDAELAPDQLASGRPQRRRRPGSSRPPGRARRACSPSGSGYSSRAAVGARAPVCAVAYNVRAKDEMAKRLADIGGPAPAQDPHAARARQRHRAALADPCRTCSTEWDVRRRIEPLVPVRPRANTDMLRAVSRSARGGAARARRARGRRGATRRRRRLRGDVRRVTATGMRDDAVMDHDEQIYGALEVLLHRRRRFGAQLQAECRHLLVDEFQDLTPAQLLMLRLVAAPAYDVFGVGDDDQVIYGYAGADPDVPHRLRPVLPRRRPPPARGELPLPGRHRRAPRRPCSPTTGCGCRRRSARPSPKARRRVAAERRPPSNCPAPPWRSVQEWLDAGARPSDDRGADACARRCCSGRSSCAREAGIPANAPIGVEVLERTGTRTGLAYLRLAHRRARTTRMSGPDLATRGPPAESVAATRGPATDRRPPAAGAAAALRESRRRHHRPTRRVPRRPRHARCRVPRRCRHRDAAAPRPRPDRARRRARHPRPRRPRAGSESPRRSQRADLGGRARARTRPASSRGCATRSTAGGSTRRPTRSPSRPCTG